MKEEHRSAEEFYPKSQAICKDITANYGKVTCRKWVNKLSGHKKLYS